MLCIKDQLREQGTAQVEGKCRGEELGRGRSRYSLLIFVFLFLHSSHLLCAETCHHDDNNFRCVEFVRNYDGDTITVNIPELNPIVGESIRTRLRGIDTPEIRSRDEMKRARAIEARDFVHDKLRKAKRIDLKNIGRCKYFRILADVIVDGDCLSSILLRKGYAKEYSGGTRSSL